MNILIGVVKLHDMPFFIVFHNQGVIYTHEKLIQCLYSISK